MTTHITEDQARIMAREAAREAVHEFWSNLGIDPSDPRQMMDLKADLAHARALRKVSNRVAAGVLEWTIKAGIGVIFTIVLSKFGIHVEKIFG